MPGNRVTPESTAALQKLEILLSDNPIGLYFAGQKISGRVLVILNEEMKLRSVRLQLSGRSLVQWTESRGSGNSRHNDTYHNEEIYVTDQLTLWGANGDSKDCPVLRGGTHWYQFHFQLPQNCPTSFEGSWGHVRYYLKVKLDRPWKYDYSHKRLLTVIGPSDLNNNFEASLAAKTSAMKTVGCLCHSSGRIEISVNIPHSGYVPGEFVPLSVIIDNSSNTAVKRVQVKLLQTVEFSGRHMTWTKTRSTINVVAEIRKEEKIPAGTMQEWAAELFRIPSACPLLSGCAIINVSYALMLEISPEGLSFSFEANLPILIGVVPLKQNFSQFSTINLTDPSKIGGALQPPFLSTYPQLVPPMYVESILGRANVREPDDDVHTTGQLDFVPKYPVYSHSV